MRLFQLLLTLDQELEPVRCKVHSASENTEGERPLDVYLAGDFEEWQSRQSQKNLGREFVISLIQIHPGAKCWLLAGAFDSRGCERVAGRSWYRYHLSRRTSPDELDGRLVVHFDREKKRQPYRLGENIEDSLLVAELRAERLHIAEFPGYSRTMLTKKHLDIVVAQEVESWRCALSSVAGVYLIADRQTGKLYVGSATGEGGFWNRWCNYAATGHGGNRELKALLREKGKQYAEHFRFGILETADSHASDKDILDCESHWKDLLMTRQHGLNAN